MANTLKAHRSGAVGFIDWLSVRVMQKQRHRGVINDRSVIGQNVAIQVDPANARGTAHLGRRLADHALGQGIDPDEARRSRAEADFLTSRARKLAPDNEEVKKLRDEVVKLLELKTN